MREPVMPLALGLLALSNAASAQNAPTGEITIWSWNVAASALEAARRNLANVSEAVVRFVHGGAERLSQLVKRPVDAVLFCNAINLVRE